MYPTRFEERSNVRCEEKKRVQNHAMEGFENPFSIMSVVGVMGSVEWG